MNTQKNPYSPTVTYLLYVSVIFAWGFSWPLTKYGIQYVSPIWFIAWRLVLGAACLFIYLLFLKKLHLPKKQDIPIILTVGLIQEGCYYLFSTSGLVQESAGRASLLVYSTPLWVTPISILFFKEKLNRKKIIGFLLGTCGFIVLFNPLTFNWQDKQIVFGNILLILASLSWAVGILHTRYGHWASSMPTLVAWQTTLAAFLFVISAIYSEPFPSMESLKTAFWPILYTGIVSSGFGAVVGFIVTRHLPVITTSISLLAVPIVGIISSCIWLHEPLTLNIVFATFLIIAGMGFMVMKDKKSTLPE
jgi:drug/metabolite transporter (DMT)-like permease